MPNKHAGLVLIAKGSLQKLRRQKDDVEKQITFCEDTMRRLKKEQRRLIAEIEKTRGQLRLLDKVLK